MKKAFTLVEMLIVVAILATLMTIVFRLGGGVQDSRRTETVVKMQKIENCLSGYYAAFGSYPPVKVHGWRDIYHKVDANGDQMDERNENLHRDQIDAACRVQPFGCEYPPSDSTENGKSEKKIIKEWAEDIKSRIGNSSEYPLYQNWSFKDAFSGDVRGSSVDGGFSGADVWTESDWKVIKLFKFGVMSFLLPRYLFMMGGDRTFFGGNSSNGKGNVCAQWGDNNDIPCNPFEGESFDGWGEVIEYAQYGVKESSLKRNDLARVANIPSQAVCARWMPNLEGLCRTLKKMEFFGINVTESTGLSPGFEGSDGEIHPPDSPNTHYAPGGKGTPYRNATLTVRDGWGNEFYYYSPPPYQSYMLWSAGKNGYTFPPWMDRKEYNDKTVEGTGGLTVAECIKDDIMQMSH